MNRREIMQMLAAGLVAGAGRPVLAQGAAQPAGFPSRPIRLVVPFPPGGAADALARPLAMLLGQKIGQNIIVENRAGANTIIGAQFVATAPADGYTLLLANEAGLSLAPEIAPITKIEVPYKPESDFAGVSLLAQYGSMLSISPKLPVRNLKEFLAYAKQHPRKLNYASFGVGSQPQMMMELLNQQTGIQTVHVAYKGVAPAILDLMAGRVQAMISAPSAPMSYVKDGRLRALAYSGSKRLAELPNVPTFAEAGLPGFEARGWFGVVMQAATPAPIRAWLSDAIWSVVQSPKYEKSAILDNGYEVPTIAPAGMPAFLAEDRAKWKRTVGDIRDRLV